MQKILKIKGLWLIPFALFIDGLQAALSMAFVGLATPVAGALQLIPGVGTLAGAAVGVFGIVMGFAVNLALSASMGVGLVFAMAFCGLFTLRIFPAFIGEIVPGFSNLPVWTGVVVWALFKKYKDDKKGLLAGVATLAKEPKTQEIVVAQKQSSLSGVGRAIRGVGREIAGAAVAILLCFSLTTTVFPTEARAQAVPPPVQYVVSPETPGPKTTVTVEAQGVGSFLGDAQITWTQDGKTVLQGVGARSYTFTTGALGQKTSIEVAIDSSQGFFAHTFSFNPSKINLLWEADTSTPLLYLGRALYSAGSSYKVVAFPTVYSGSARVVPSALSYQWSYKGDVVPEASGLGRATLSRTGDQLQAGEEIGLEVYYGTAKVGATQLTIPAAQPNILLYPRDPLRGEILEAALPLGGIALTSNEITVQAEPYYISKSALVSGQAAFAWTINGEAAVGPDSSRGILTLRAAGSGQGEAQLGVSVQNTIPDQFVQNASVGLRLVFGQQSGNALLDFFGL